MKLSFDKLTFDFSDEALLEVVTDSYAGIRRSSGSSCHSRYEESMLSCQSYEDLSYLQRLRRSSSFPTANTPLLLSRKDT